MKKSKVVLVSVVVCLVSFFSGIARGQTPSGNAVIQQMHERYQNSWYDYLTFKQETIYYKDGEADRSQWWYEALGVPGQLVIKFDSLDSGTGIIFRQDSQYVFQKNKLVQQGPRVHDLLVLGFDVYGEPPVKTIEKLEGRGFDLTKTYETEWQGRPVYVVGASGENDTSNQFWIDKEHLYFVRLLRVNAGDGTVQEVQFNNYERVGGGWVAPIVLFFNNDELALKEVYSKIEAPENLDASIFDLENFQQARW